MNNFPSWSQNGHGGKLNPLPEADIHLSHLIYCFLPLAVGTFSISGILLQSVALCVSTKTQCSHVEQVWDVVIFFFLKKRSNRSKRIYSEAQHCDHSTRPPYIPTWHTRGKERVKKEKHDTRCFLTTKENNKRCADHWLEAKTARP